MLCAMDSYLARIRDSHLMIVASFPHCLAFRTRVGKPSRAGVIQKSIADSACCRLTALLTLFAAGIDAYINFILLLTIGTMGIGWTAEHHLAQ